MKAGHAELDDKRKQIDAGLHELTEMADEHRRRAAETERKIMDQVREAFSNTARGH
jgi:hypothetical protein